MNKHIIIKTLCTLIATMLLSATFVCEAMPSDNTYTEGFETDNFLQYNWEFNRYPWTTSIGEVHDGEYSAMSTNRKNNSESSMWVTMNVLSESNITFYYNVSSEEDHDKFEFYIDGELKGSWSGEIDWTLFSTPVAAGIHTFKWNYSKDSANSSGYDCVWIDDITFPTVNLEDPLQPVTNLLADVVGYQVTLTWNLTSNATKYVVIRDGVPVATTTGNSFFETVDNADYYVYNVVAANSSKVSKPASINVNINKPLHWSSNPYLYDCNMSVTSVIQLDGEEQYVNTLEVGAFCGDECRGSQMAQYFPPTGRYILSLTVSGVSGDIITFRLYNHETDEEADAICYDKLTFVSDAVVGSLVSPYVINFKNSVDQCTTLVEGNNWYSTYITIDGTEGLDLIKTGLESSATMVKSQTAFTQYYDDYGWFGGLAAANNEEMYIINITENYELCLNGQLADPSEHPITLNQYWNWIGYPVNIELELNTAFADISLSNNDIIKSQGNYSTYYEGYGWFGGLNTMTPGHGYMLYRAASTPQNFTYPSARGNGETLQANLTAQDNHWVPNINKFPTNMNVIVTISIDGEMQRGENLEVAAFCNGEVRGSARPMYFEPLDEYVLMLTIYGNEGDNLTFKLFDTETGLEYTSTAKESLTYSENAIVGTLDEPFVLNFNIANGIGENEMSNVSVYPNPAQCGKEIVLSTMCETVEVFNSIGVKVAEYHNIERIDNINSAGSYIIKMTNGETIVYDKIIVK